MKYKFENGGIVKLQGGGVDFNKNWYSKRKSLLGKNAKEYGKDVLVAKYTGKPNKNVLVGPFEYKQIDTNLNEKLLGDTELNRILSNLNNIKIDYSNSKNNGVYGQYNNTSHSFTVYSDSPDVRTEVHESNHGARLNVQKKMIENYINTHKNSYIKNGNPNEYLDSPDEILSRRQEFLQEWKVDPTTIHELKNIKSFNFWPNLNQSKIIENITSPKSSENYNFLLRYSPEFIQFLLNDVADSSKSVDNTNISKRGGIIKAQKGRIINYSGISPSYDKNLKYIDNELQKAGYGYIQRLAILGNVMRESRGNPLAISPNGTWHGIIQWNKDRYRLQSRNPQEELERQTQLLLKELEKKGWSGQTWKDQLAYAQSFKDTTDLNQAVDIFTRRFVRPANIDSEIKKRLAFAQNGWTEEVQNDFINPSLEDSLNVQPVIIDNNNKVVDTSPKQEILKRPEPKVDTLQKPKGLPTEDEIRDLIYRSFKYQKGGLVYKPFMGKDPNTKVTTENDWAMDFDSDETLFPVEPVSVYSPFNMSSILQDSVSQPGEVVYKSNDIDVKNMSDVVSFLVQNGVRFRVTSGYRKGAISKSGNPSKHSFGNAIDITPINGEDFNKLLTYLNNPRVAKGLEERGVRIIHEITKEQMAKTGATGPHIHLELNG